MVSAAPLAVSAWPPEPPMMTPSDFVVTLTLKSRSTSAAPSATALRRSTTAPPTCGPAYIAADIA